MLHKYLHEAQNHVTNHIQNAVQQEGVCEFISISLYTSIIQLSV